MFQPSPMVMSFDRETERKKIAAKIRFLSRVAGLRLRDRVRSSDIQRELKVELLFLCVDGGQLRWFGHLIWMPPVGGLPVTSNWQEASS